MEDFFFFFFLIKPLKDNLLFFIKTPLIWAKFNPRSLVQQVNQHLKYLL